MRTPLITFIAGFLLILSESFGQSYGLGNNDPSVFSRFRIPETDLHSLQFTSGLSYNSNSFKASPSNNSAFTSYTYYTVTPSYYLLNETDDRYFSVSSNLNGTYRRSYDKNENPSLPQNYERTTNSYEAGLFLGGIYRIYQNPGEMFYSLESDISVLLSESYTDFPASNINHRYSGWKRQSYTIAFGIGWGKMRNVTSVVSALRFQERLKQLSLVSSDLTGETIEALAEQFYRQGYYGQVRVRPDKFFWQDVEKTLAAEGITLNGISQYGNSYLRETPGELRFSRNEGTIIGARTQFEYDNDYNSTSSQKINEQFFTLANLYAGYSHQLNLNSQVAFNFSISGGPNLTKNSEIRQQYGGSARLAYSYELTDRLVVIADNEFNLIFFNAQNQGRSLTNSLTARVIYFLEDQLSLNGSYEWRFSGFKGTFTPGHGEQITNNVQIGFAYYISRGFLNR
ncbi:MAG: hypothetical protein ACRDGA_14570 [Bacteroidota bacterium]